MSVASGRHLRVSPQVAHIKAAVERGAAREEISETLGMAIYMSAGPSVMYASHAFAALHQFEAEKTVQST